MLRRAYRYRAYPNKTQEAALTVQFGHARFVYNWGLATRKDYYREHGKGLGYYALKRMVTGSGARLAEPGSQRLLAFGSSLGGHTNTHGRLPRPDGLTITPR